MSRKEFSAKTKRAAWNRSSGRCEAEGALYGLPPGVRCTADLNLGVEYDHVDPDAQGHNNTLENCAAVCPKDHDWKTRHRDRPLIAKTNHQQDMARNIEKRGKRKITPHIDPWGKNRYRAKQLEDL